MLNIYLKEIIKVINSCDVFVTRYSAEFRCHEWAAIKLLLDRYHKPVYVHIISL